jgi:O-antigen/teichoic acid export membrane protein
MSIYYFYHLVEHRKGGRPTLIAQTFVMLAISGAVAAGALAIGSPLLAAKFSNPQLKDLLPPFAAYVGLAITGELFMHVMISQNRYAAAVILETLETVLRVGVIVSALYLGLGLYGLVLAMLAFAAFRLFGRGFFLVSGPDSLRGASPKFAFPAEQLAYSLPLAASTCVGIVGNTLDRAIVAMSFSPVDYAVYSVGALEIPLDVIFQASVANVLRATLPALVAAGAYAEIVRIWRASVRKLALIVIPSTVFLFAFADLFITTLFTAKYHESVAVFRIYVAHLPLHMVVVSLIPQVFGRTRLNLKVVFVAASTNIVLSLVLLRFLGYLGPAVAYVVSSYIAVGLYFAEGRRLLKTGFFAMIPVAAMARTTLASGISVVAALLATHYGPGGIVGLAVAGVAFGVTYLLAAPLVGAVLSDDLRTAKAWLRPALSTIGVHI